MKDEYIEIVVHCIADRNEYFKIRKSFENFLKSDWYDGCGNACFKVKKGRSGKIKNESKEVDEI